MPLQFESISHGPIAFGFFNIETDMILLNHTFLFAEDFCRYMIEAAEKHDRGYEALWEVFRIDDDGDIGNLMGAIYGVDDRGFIGEVYRRFPFPRERAQFRQNPEGYKNRSLMEKLIQKYARRAEISFSIGQKDDRIAIGEYLFDKRVFHDLIRYIWIGGFPRWKDAIRPDYVRAMREKIEASENPLLKDLLFEEDEASKKKAFP